MNKLIGCMKGKVKIRGDIMSTGAKWNASKKICWPDFFKRAKKIFKTTKGKPLSQIVIENRKER